MRKLLLIVMIALTSLPRGLAQINSFCQAHSDTLYCKIPTLFGNAVVSPLQPLDESLATQLTLVPLASPASGIVYSKDPATKLPRPSGTETLGPVLTERGETLYHGKLFFAFTDQRFRFNSIDGIDMKNLPMVFNLCSPAGQCGIIATIVRADAHLDQYAFFGTYGVTDWLDVSAALPILRVSLAANGVKCFDPYCSFTTPGGYTANFTPTKVSGSASGIGDVVLRAKVRALDVKKFKLSLGTDVRLPTGDTLNLLGSGSVGVKPFLAISRSGRISPHVNLAYQWNGSSLLAGQIAGEKGKLPENLSYIGGIDTGVSSRLTVSVDFLGEHVVNSSRLLRITTQGISSVRQAQGSFESDRGAIGLKWRPWRELLITGNVLDKFDHNGLHHTVVPLIGISYTSRTPYERR